MVGPFVRGAGYALRGLTLVAHPRLRGFVLIPLAINLLLFGGGLWWGGSALADWIDRQIAALPDWLHWLHWLIVPVLVVAAALVLFYGFSVLANLLGAPFNSLLAERVEDLLHPGRVRPAGRSLLGEASAAIGGAVRALVYFVACALPLLVLLFIPGLNAAFPFVWLAFSAWMLALQYLDYPMGNHGLNFAEQRRRHAGNRRLVFGFGAGVLLLTLVPGLNFLAMPAGVIGATLLWAENPQPPSAGR